MSVFEHSRHKIFNPAQHPLKHDISDFAYANSRLPGVSLLADAIDWIIASIYPNYKGTVANQAALPVSGSPNDYYVVSDDGDGKSAGYVWSVIDNTGSWIKRYDVDWSFENILAEAVNRTMPMYVHKYGLDDQDGTGAPITGTLAGQSIYGGASANSNLTLHANSGDTLGGNTGFVQISDALRPTANGVFTNGTNTDRWSNVYTNSLTSGTLVATGGSITDTSGAISFNDENLSTTGSISSGTLAVTTSATIGNLSLSNGSITCSGGTISFGSSNLTTTGTVTGAANSKLADLTFAAGSITSVTATISFGSNNLSTTGTLNSGNATVTRLDADNVRVDGNTISVTNTNGNLIVGANGTGVVDVQSPLTTLGQTVTGTVSITGQLNIDNLRLDGNVLSSTNLNGNITLTPNGTGKVEAGATVYPTASATQDLGQSGSLWANLWLSGGIKDGTNTLTTATLMSLRNVATTVSTGDTLFWDGSKWVASHPDTEIAHSEVSGLTTGDAGHTQFAMLAGRSGGQTVQGGTAASENLTLESTSNASKGTVYTKDNFKPFTNASYSSSWSGTDLGDNTHYFRDVFSKGEFRGFRFENYTSSTLPSASASAKGRMAFATDNNKLYVDTGGAWAAAGGGAKFLSDTSWDGVVTLKDVTVSSTITDARNCIWQLMDNTNNYEIMFVKITPTSASNVRITTNIPLPAGSYRLIGLE